MQFGKNEKQHLFKTLRKITSLYERCFFYVLFNEVFLFCPSNTLPSIFVTMLLSSGINLLIRMEEICFWEL